jgi:bacillithiol biosynthesis deacetylase BshB1
MVVDVLAFGVHPDDVELGCGGLLIQEKLLGKKTAIVDLTQGELGSRGTIQTRYDEAAAAAAILKVDARDNIKIADGFFVNDKAHQIKVIEQIRKYRPEVIICNAPEDRHPDHGRSADLVTDAAFLSGLAKIETNFEGEAQEHYRPKYVLHYIQDRYLNPDVLYDISEVFEQKLESIRAYKTQFYNPEIEGPETYISTPGFLDSVIYRAKMLGKLIGVEYAEGFTSKKHIGIQSLDALIKKTT